MSVRAFKLLATAFNFNVATGLKQEISSFYAAAVSTQDLFYESKVNFKYSDDFNVRYSSDLGVALMSAAPVLSIMTQISAALMLLIMAPMPAAPMLSLMAPMPAAQIPNPDQIAYWHSAPRHAFVAHYFCDHILAIMIVSSTPCQEWQSKSIVKYCFETAGYKLIVALKYATRCSSDFQITAFLCKERAIFREGDVGRPSTSEGYDITITSSAKPHSVLVREGDGEYGIERVIAFTFSTSIELGASEKVRAIRHRRESRHRPHHEYHTRIKLSRIRPRRSNSWRSSSHRWRNVNRKCRSHRVAKRQQSSANEKDCSENYVIYKPHPIVLIDDSSVCEGGSTTRTILFAFLSAVMVTSTTDLASSIRERDRNTQGIARAITFKFSVLLWITAAHNTWAGTVFLASKVVAAMTATINASTSNVRKGVGRAFLAFVNEGATAALIAFTTFTALFILAGHLRVKIKTATTTTKDSTVAVSKIAVAAIEPAASTTEVVIATVASEIAAATMVTAASIAAAFLFRHSIFEAAKKTNSVVTTIVLAEATIKHINRLQLQIGCNASSSKCTKIIFHHLDCYRYIGIQYGAINGTEVYPSLANSYHHYFWQREIFGSSLEVLGTFHEFCF